LTRPHDRHLDELELGALVALSEHGTPSAEPLSTEAADGIRAHLDHCSDCSALLRKHIQAQQALAALHIKFMPEREKHCPENVDWVALASGFLPFEQSEPLMQHAADCGYCGAELRDATEILCEDVSPAEEQMIASIRLITDPVPFPYPGWRLALQALLDRLLEFFRSLVKIPILQPVAAILFVAVIIFGGWVFFNPVPITPGLSGVTLPQFSSMAVQLHRERIQGILQLDVKASTSQSVSEWVAGFLPMPKKLPSLPPATETEQAYTVEGASKVSIGNAYAALVVYKLPAEVVSLLVVPDSVVKADGGVKVQYTKDLTFHYGTIEGYKVVTWSIHGITYALVSGAEAATQKSCMVCHAAMNDQRDFSKTPFPTMPAANTAH
jgi:hypothetical protein